MRRISWIVFFVAFIGICDAIPCNASTHFPFVERNFVISKGLPCADRQEKCECSNGLPSAGRPQTLDYGHLILYSIGGLIGIAIGLLIRLWVYFYEKYFYRRGY